MGLIHRDLKPSNVMIDMECCVRMVDFGLSKSVSKRPNSPHVITRPYRSPEICLEEKYDQRADIFSLGCIFYELMVVTLAQAKNKSKEETEYAISKRLAFRNTDSCMALSPNLY